MRLTKNPNPGDNIRLRLLDSDDTTVVEETLVFDVGVNNGEAHSTSTAATGSFAFNDANGFDTGDRITLTDAPTPSASTWTPR